MNYFSVFDHFKCKSGSKIWPSSDPNDVPFDKFTCKHCGASTELEMYGARHINEPSFEDRARKRLLEHLLICPSYTKERIKK